MVLGTICIYLGLDFHYMYIKFGCYICMHVWFTLEDAILFHLMCAVLYIKGLGLGL